MSFPLYKSAQTQEGVGARDDTAHFLTTSGSLQVDSRYEYACGLRDDGNIEAAIDLLEQTLPLALHWPVLPFTLGKFYKEAGNTARATEYFEHSRTLDPDDHQGAALELERLGLTVIDDIMPPAFVETLFDQYADHFDEHLVGALDYAVPKMIAQEAWKYYAPQNTVRILDLGCGTGLAGEHLKPIANYLEGVDLSTRMLEQARQKGLYDKLEQGEWVAYLKQSTAPFNLIIAADVLSYFGTLESVFEAAAPRLANGGHFIFSVQALPTPPPDPAHPNYHLGPARRFSHAKAYIAETIEASGLTLVNIKSVILRKDEGKNVQGYLVV